jgi:hypothetical protein
MTKIGFIGESFVMDIHKSYTFNPIHERAPVMSFIFQLKIGN